MHETLAKAGGTVLAISADPVDKAKKMVEGNELPFDILSDENAETITAYGLLFHEPLGRGDIALPANFLVDRDGKVAWRWIAKRVQDRADPAAVLAAVEQLLADS